MVDFRSKGTQLKVLTIIGTRPEAIKLAPVIWQLEKLGGAVRTINVLSSQHTDILSPFVRYFNIRIDHDFQIMEADQTPEQVCSGILTMLDPILSQEAPDLLLVQGDTTTALAGALAGFHRRIAVGHVEAGLRSGNLSSPYPEERNRVHITRLATWHFAATSRNRDTLLSEGVPPERIFVTGNPVVDVLLSTLKRATASSLVDTLLQSTGGMKRIVLTTHRRESFGDAMARNLSVLRDFVEQHEDVALLFPVHPNPAVTRVANEILAGHRRIHLVQPMDYEAFIVLLSHAWLIVSDSGGVQEEAPTLGKPLLILRENTERPEVVESGVARLVGGSPENLAAMLEEAYGGGSWADRVWKIENPFGRGDSGERIARIIVNGFGAPQAEVASGGVGRDE